MQRRDVLRFLGSVGVAGLAGCAAPAASPNSRFDPEAPCPDSIDLCYHELTDEQVFLYPDSEQVTIGDEVQMHLVNRSDHDLFIGPDYWWLWRLEDGEWVDIRPRNYVLDMGAGVPAGGSYVWNLAVHAEASDGRSSAFGEITEAAFEPGRYCFEARDVDIGDEKENEHNSFGAIFDVVEA
ncbi:hypothetical protein [Haloferax sp. DFSO60]|uniref:hypothetical protein n=1 Tax=Haloferax sp. DFSO60 TaxID=3388652 RepID=UPI003978F2AF